jgi:hypothetical protein
MVERHDLTLEELRCWGGKSSTVNTTLFERDVLESEWLVSKKEKKNPSIEHRHSAADPYQAR